jgi:hypothetical protein
MEAINCGYRLDSARAACAADKHVIVMDNPFQDDGNPIIEA